jgi:alcohol dehydrogenase class IV
LVLPYVLEFNMPEAEALYAELGAIVFPELAGKACSARAEGLVEGLMALGPELGMQTRLSEVGVSHNNLPMLAEDAMKQTRLLVNNPREMTYEAALKIYEAAL